MIKWVSRTISNLVFKCHMWKRHIFPFFKFAAWQQNCGLRLSLNQMQSRANMTFQFSSTTGQQQQQHKHDGRWRGEDTCNSQRETDNDNDALLIQYKRNNIGFPFPHPLRSWVYSCQLPVAYPGWGKSKGFFSVLRPLRPFDTICYWVAGSW